MPQNIGDNRVLRDGIARVTEREATRLARYRVRCGDIVCSRRGDVERRTLIREPEDGWLCGTGSLRVRFGAGHVHPQYASYYLGDARVREWIVRHAHGATMPNLNTAILSDLPFVLPPVEEQRAIAHILGTLDDRIELNRRMNETLEAMARALFKSWFVDFDPVRAKAASLVDDGILEIGDGYRAKNTELGGPGLPFIRAGDLDGGFDTNGADLLRVESVDKAGSKVCRPGDVAFTSKGTIGRFARVTEHTGAFVYSPQVCYWRSLNSRVLNPITLYCWMQSDDFGSQLAAVAGQTDMAPYVSLRDQREIMVPVFPDSQAATARRIDALLERQAKLTDECTTLARIRDGLLPKLISGELHLCNASMLLERNS